MARYSQRSLSYVFLNVLAYFASLSLEQLLTRFATAWMLFFGFLGRDLSTSFTVEISSREELVGSFMS